MSRLKEKVFRVLNAAGLFYNKKILQIFNVDSNYTINRDSVHSTFEGVRFKYDFAALGTTGNIDYAQWAEDATRRALFARIGNAKVFYDVGAHGGAYTLTLRTSFPNLRVISFEPQPEELRENMQLNAISDADVQPVAVGNEEGEVRMTTGHRSSNHVSQSGDRVVRCVRIDDYAAEKGLPVPDWIKIDIEGLELPALRGAEGLLRQGKPTIICEINQLFSRFGTTMREFSGFLEGLGYRIYRLQDDTLQTVPSITESLYLDHPSDDNNYWFVHADKAEAINRLN